jgi:hypothetical protein
MSEGKRVPASAGDEARADRLAAALRANLKRRKAQARAKEEEQPGAEPAADPEIKKP